MKPTKSNEALNYIGKVRANNGVFSNITADGHEHISYKHLRWVLRGVQIFLGIINFSLSVAQDRSLLKANHLTAMNIVNSFLTFLFILLPGFLAGIYFWKYFGKWSAKKVLYFETSFDFVAMVYFVTAFSVMVNNIGYGDARGNQCPPGVSDQCDKFNWLIAFSFFTFVSWLVSFGADIGSWIKLLGEYKGQMLSEIDMHRLRSSRTTR